MPSRWDQVEEILGAVLVASEPERAATIARLCGNDEDLRHEVESLLAAHGASEGFLATSATSFAAPYLRDTVPTDGPHQAGTRLGPYRLIEQIGRGGMGSVWRAERCDGEFEQRVALKLIRGGIDTDDVVARFRRERQILARLEHPNIARLLDGGVGPDGRPFLVMELVDGLPITSHCDDRQLTIEERLRLFIVACRAVGFAHRNLVVHRDIKPSNVLVSEGGELKLLDFGIARLLDEESPDGRTGVTRRLLTPEYASPEQAGGAAVTTASDIYQLGILLYELLTGRRPHGAESPATAPVRRPSSVIRETDPAAGRPVLLTPERLRSRLRGDLDSIALRALREEPELRYPTAEALAEDVERHLGHLPLRFGGGTTAYRLRKFIRRHRLGVAMAGASLALSIMLVGVDLVRVRRQRDLAQHEADKAVETAQLMSRFLRGWSPDASDRGEVSARKLLGAAVTRAERELRTRPEMLGATLSILGDFHTTLGEWMRADSLLTRAGEIQESLGSGADGDRAATLIRQSRLDRERGRYQDAERAARAGIHLHLAGHGPDHPETLRAIRELGAVFTAWKKPAEAETQLRGVLEHLDSTAASSPFGLEVAGELGYALLSQGKTDQAVAILRPTLQELRALFGEVDASTLAATRMLASALRDRGDLVEAESLYRAALRIARTLYGEEHSETQSALFVLALLLERRNQLEEAETLARKSIALGDRLYGPAHYNQWYGYGHLGAIRLDRGDTGDAERLLRRARTGMIDAGATRDPDGGDVLNRLAWLLVRRGTTDADRIYREATEFDDSRPKDAPDFVTDGVHFLAAAALQQGDSTRAIATYRRALKVYLIQLPPDHPYRTDAVAGLAAALGRRIGASQH